MQKIITLLLILILIFSACGNGEKTLEITPEEEKEGYILMPDYGIKYKQPVSFKTYANNISPFEAEGENEDSPLEKQFVIEFVPDEIIQKYQEIDKDENLSDEEKFQKINEEVWGNTKPLMAFSIIKADKLPGTEKGLTEITGFSINKEVGKYGEFIQYFSTSNPDTEGLSEKSQADYKVLLSEIEAIPETVTAGTPKSLSQSLAQIKNLKFQTQDLNGEPVTEEVFGKADLTLVNVWATWCPPCKEELPNLAKISEKYKSKNVQVLGILSDSILKEEGQSKDTLEEKDLEVVELAKKILSENTAGYLNIKVSPNINSKIMPFVTGLPTTFFMDKQGNVVGEALVGARSEEEFSEAIDKVLKDIAK